MKDVQLLMIPVDKISADPNQPRTVIDEEQLKGMAASMLIEGVINPIELDPFYSIITGEMRWRAAKKAGLTEIPAKIIAITPDLRYRRQVIENLHHNTMTPMDTARALVKLLLQFYDTSVDMTTPMAKDIALSNMAKAIGKERNKIAQIIDLLEEKDAEIVEYLEHKDSNFTIIRHINTTHFPDEMKQRLKKKVARGELKDVQTIREITRAILRNPEKTEDILTLSYLDSPSENLYRIHRFSPPIIEHARGETREERLRRESKKLSNSIGLLLEFMSGAPLEELNVHTLAMLYDNTVRLPTFITAFNMKIKALLDMKTQNQLQSENTKNIS